MQQYTEQELMDIASQRETKNKVIQTICGDVKPASQKLGIFMAGSPGAGKTELAQNLKRELDKKSKEYQGVFSNIVHLEQDKIKSTLHGYTGTNAPLYQKPASRLLASVYKYVLKNGLSFIHDTTFSSQNVAEQNIQQALKNGYLVQLYFVYQNPQNAWHMVQQREQEEGRVVPKESFVKQFIHSRKVIDDIKSKFSDNIEINIIIKDIHNETQDTNKEIYFNEDTIDRRIHKTYSKEEILRIIN